MNYFFDKWSPGIILGGHQEKTASHYMLQVTSAEGVGYMLVFDTISKQAGSLMLCLLPCVVGFELSGKITQVLLPPHSSLVGDSHLSLVRFVLQSLLKECT